MKKILKGVQSDKFFTQKTLLVKAMALGALSIGNSGIGDANAANCSPVSGTDISTMGGVNSGTISCDAASNNPTSAAPVINTSADQSSFTNSGTIKNTVTSNGNDDPTSFLSTKGIGTFENSGTIGLSTSNSGSGLQLYGSSAIFSVLSNTSTGQIVSYSQDALYLNNGAKITTLNNAGQIKNLTGDSAAGIHIRDAGSQIGVLNNLSTGSISGGRGIQNRESLITTINNAGSIYGTASTDQTFGIYQQGSTSKIVTLNNTGSIYTLASDTAWSFGDTAAIIVAGEITNLSNSGSIYGNELAVHGIYIRSGGTIGTLTNTGAIYGGASGIYNDGVIGTFSNAQGGNASTAATTALKYYGNLPTNYNIIVNSATSYGQLNYYKGSAGAPSLAGLNFGVSSTSTLAVGTYSSVLSSKNSTFSAAGTAFTGTPTLVSSSLGTYTLTTSDSGLTYDLNILTVSGGGGGGSSSNSATYTNYVTSTNNPAAAGAANALGQVSNPTGSMATITTYLSGSATDQQKSNAISQTLPVIVGAAPAATVNTSRSLTQIVQARQSQAAGLSSGEEFIANKDVWMKGFGVWGKQNDLNGVSGYKLSTGGLALGGDRSLSPRANIGGVLAFANSNVNGSNPSAPNSMVINSYQVGGYGDYAITDKLNYNYQVDVGVNQNKGTRNILVAGVNASSNYYSYSGHLGSGLKYMMPVAEKLTFIPSTRVDYTQVQSNAYSETGAGTLNLQTNSQKYEELLVSADLRLDYELTEKMKGTINAGVAYNTMNNQVQMTSIYQGGGPSFTTNGMQVSPTLYEGGFGIIGNITKDVELIGRYDAQYRTTGYFSQMASIRAKINF